MEENETVGLAGLRDSYVRLKTRIASYLDTRPKIRMLILFLAIYVFILAIKTMGTGLKLFKGDVFDRLEHLLADPLSSFMIGLLLTGVVQSSSATTSIMVGLVATGEISVGLAVPAILGANIGTAVTNTLVAMGHVGQKEEFRRAFGGSLVHDYFNLLAVAIMLPLEILFHPLQKLAELAEKLVGGQRVNEMRFPLDFIIDPITKGARELMLASWSKTAVAIVMALVGIILLFVSLRVITASMRYFVMGLGTRLVDRYLFRNSLASFSTGLGLTVAVQSSSITSSLLVPLLGADVVKLRKILPFTIGSNVGTTITAILAAFTLLGSEGAAAAITLALVHLFFNLIAGIIIYFIPFLREIPLRLAEMSGDLVVDNPRGKLYLIGGYVIGTSYVLPIIYLVLATLIRGL